MNGQGPSRTKSDPPDYVRSLELADAMGQNEKLRQALAEGREDITAPPEKGEKLTGPPATHAIYLSPHEGGTANGLAQGRKAKVNAHPSIVVSSLRPGQELILNEGLNIIDVAGYEIQGEVVILKEQLDGERAIVTLRADEDKVGVIADPLRATRLKIGDDA